jgi:hypothetical protein
VKARRWILSVFATTTLVASGCSEDAVKAIAEAVKNEADDVKLTDTALEAKCKTGETVKVAKEELEMNVLGMIEFEKQEKAAKSIADQCDAFKKQERKEDVQLSAFKKVAEEKKLDIEGKDVEAARKIICDALAAELPLKGDRRTELITRNTTSYGCEDPGEPELGPERYWVIEEDKGTVYLKLNSEEKEDSAPDRFTIRCKRGKKLDAYFATTDRLKKGRITGKADKRRVRWSANLAKSKKAIFLKKPKKDLKALKGKKKLYIRYPAAKKVEATFDIDGVDAAFKKLKGRCRV